MIILIVTICVVAQDFYDCTQTTLYSYSILWFENRTAFLALCEIPSIHGHNGTSVCLCSTNSAKKKLILTTDKKLNTYNFLITYKLPPNLRRYKLYNHLF